MRQALERVFQAVPPEPFGRASCSNSFFLRFGFGAERPECEDEYDEGGKARCDEGLDHAEIEGVARYEQRSDGSGEKQQETDKQRHDDSFRLPEGSMSRI